MLALKKTADLIYSGSYDSVSRVYDSACGSAPCSGPKMWLIDIDTKDEHTLQTTALQLAALNVEVKAIVPSLHGNHILTTPFPVIGLQKLKDVAVLKDAMVILYLCLTETDRV